MLWATLGAFTLEDLILLISPSAGMTLERFVTSD